MSITTIIEVFIGLLSALGSWEFVKYFLNRKSEKRKASAEASIVEREADKASVELTDSKYQSLLNEYQEEIVNLRQQLDFAVQHQKTRSEMIEELQQKMTDLVSVHQQQLVEKQSKIEELMATINTLTSKVTALTLLRCKDLTCAHRRPPTSDAATAVWKDGLMEESDEK